MTFWSCASGLTCGWVTPVAAVPSTGNYVTVALSYKYKNVGVEFGYRFNPRHRLIAGFDYIDPTRDRIEFGESRDYWNSIEYGHMALDSVGIRAKCQHLVRHSNFLENDAGVSDPHYTKRIVTPSMRPTSSM